MGCQVGVEGYELRGGGGRGGVDILKAVLLQLGEGAGWGAEGRGAGGAWGGGRSGESVWGGAGAGGGVGPRDGSGGGVAAWGGGGGGIVFCRGFISFWIGCSSWVCVVQLVMVWGFFRYWGGAAGEGGGGVLVVRRFLFHFGGISVSFIVVFG